MANAKIHINLHQGLIEAEGDEVFVTRVYEDFKIRLSAVPLTDVKSDELLDQSDHNGRATALTFPRIGGHP